MFKSKSNNLARRKTIHYYQAMWVKKMGKRSVGTKFSAIDIFTITVANTIIIISAVNWAVGSPTKLDDSETAIKYSELEFLGRFQLEYSVQYAPEHGNSTNFPVVSIMNL